MVVTRSKKSQLTIEENYEPFRKNTANMKKMELLLHEAKHFIFGNALEWERMREAFVETLVKKKLQQCCKEYSNPTLLKWLQMDQIFQKCEEKLSRLSKKPLYPLAKIIVEERYWDLQVEKLAKSINNLHLTKVYSISIETTEEFVVTHPMRCKSTVVAKPISTVESSTQNTLFIQEQPIQHMDMMDICTSAELNELQDKSCYTEFQSTTGFKSSS